MAASLSSSEILQELREFRELGRVLFIAAHPDDENTRLIAYLAKARGYATAYLSITRGDGGQNLIGPELGEELGVIRTQELLAARRIDGGRQFFTRAVDFGFSKDHAETLAVWDRAAVLGDVVRTIRRFRPDVVVTRFTTEPGETHGHHTASAILAQEAFARAGDPAAYPEQLGPLAPWSPRRLVWNVFQPRGAKPPPPPADALRLDVGEYLPLLGASAGELAARSRSMHRSQGMGTLGTRGASPEFFKVLAGAPATADLMEGIDTSWARVPGGAAIIPQVGTLIARFDPLAPEASVPALLALRRALAALAPDPTVAEKAARLDRILVACLGLHVETRGPATAVPGETLELDHAAIVRSRHPVRWLGVRLPGRDELSGLAVALEPNQPATLRTSSTLAPGTRVSQPYWLEEPGSPGSNRLPSPDALDHPEDPPAVPLVHRFEVDGQVLEVEDEPVLVVADPVDGERRERLRVIPPVTLDFVRSLELLAPGSTRPVSVELTAARTGVSGELRLDAPAGWAVSPASHPFALRAPGDRARVDFTLTAPGGGGAARVAAVATVGKDRHDRRRVEIRHAHIPPQLLHPRARLTAVSFELATRGRRVGYLPGAGDEVATCLGRMGFEVVPLKASELSPEGLAGLDAVVLGIRAFNTRDDLAPHLDGLFAWVEAGGTVIAQYNTPNGLKSPRLAPYPLRPSRERVTDQTAAVEFLVPDHPALTTPNRLGPGDFTGWVQERGVCFPDQWDERFTPLLAMADPGEGPKKGALLVARHGKGWYVYSGLAWFRQLPEGVPGAYRLFANLVGLR